MGWDSKPWFIRSWCGSRGVELTTRASHYVLFKTRAAVLYQILNTRRSRVFHTLIKHVYCECFKWLKKRTILSVYLRSNFQNKPCLSRKIKFYVNQGKSISHIKIRHAYHFSLCFPHELLMTYELLSPFDDDFDTKSKHHKLIFVLFKLISWLSRCLSSYIVLCILLTTGQKL